MRKIDKIILIIAGISFISIVIIHNFYIDFESSPGFSALVILVTAGIAFLVANCFNHQYPLFLRIIGIILFILLILLVIYLRKKGVNLRL